MEKARASMTVRRAKTLLIKWRRMEASSKGFLPVGVGDRVVFVLLEDSTSELVISRSRFYLTNRKNKCVSKKFLFFISTSKKFQCRILSLKNRKNKLIITFWKIILFYFATLISLNKKDSSRFKTQISWIFDIVLLNLLWTKKNFDLLTLKQPLWCSTF